MTSDIVTMEDILEELVGEIWDEKDEPIESIYKEYDTTYRINTDISIDNFFDFFNLSLDDNSESTTVNGWIIEKCNEIPCEGYSFAYEGLLITITKVSNTHTQEIKVEIPNAKAV